MDDERKEKPIGFMFDNSNYFLLNHNTNSRCTNVNNLIKEPLMCKRESFNENCFGAIKEEEKRMRLLIYFTNSYKDP